MGNILTILKFLVKNKTGEVSEEKRHFAKQVREKKGLAELEKSKVVQFSCAFLSLTTTTEEFDRIVEFFVKFLSQRINRLWWIPTE